MAASSGLVPKEIIRLWLRHYACLKAGDEFPDALPTNSGPKSFDGVSGMMLNKIMLEEAISKLGPVIRYCVIARWIKQQPLRISLQRLGISKDVYYSNCDTGIHEIYLYINRNLMIAGNVDRVMNSGA